MKSAVARAIGTKSVNYLMGFVAGYVIESVTGDNTFYIEEGNHAKIFKTKISAIRAAKELNVKSPKFVKGYIYSTPNPENAKGMPLISDVNSEEIKIEFID